MCKMHQRRNRELLEIYIWEKGSTQHWIKNQCQQNPNMERSPIPKTEVPEVLRITLNWKAPGRDQIAHFCLKQLKATCTYLETPFNKLTEVGQIPEYGQE